MEPFVTFRPESGPASIIAPVSLRLGLAPLIFIIAVGCSFCTLFSQSIGPSPLDDPAIVSSAGISSMGAPLDPPTSASTEIGADTGTPLPLSSAQIFELLSAHPDIIVELKQYIAEDLSRRGSQVQDSDISDEMLYSQIVSSAQVRTDVTTFLRTRGYLSGDGVGVLKGSYADGLEPSQRALGMGRRETPVAGARSRSSRGGEDDFDSDKRGGLGIDTRETGQPSSIDTSTVSIGQSPVLHLPAPYNLNSMRDLYTQVPGTEGRLKRFGADLFSGSSRSLSRDLSSQSIPLDVPIGPDYILGAGDTLTFTLWGGTTQTFTRTLDRAGQVLLPEAGPVVIGGFKLSDAQKVLEAAIQAQYRNARLSVTVSRLHSVRVYVVGDVQRPGAYDIGALATPISALFAAGGPSGSGSLRRVRHLRGDLLVEETDLYDLLLNGIHSGPARFQSGDTVLVPPVGPQIAISGAVTRPAIYELKSGEEMLDATLRNAGGLTVSAALDHITVERVGQGGARETLSVMTKEDTNDKHSSLARFALKDGDHVHVGSILPYSERVLYLEGHVARPGRVPYSDGMQLSDVLHSYHDLLPEPARKGELIRLVPPDLHAETISFDVPDVLTGNSRIALHPFDTVRVFGRYQEDAPRVTITGEVLRPGSFPLSENMTISQLVRLAGGFKRDAYLQDADLTSYSVIDGKRVVGDLRTVPIGSVVNGNDSNADQPLKAGDILNIHQVAGWTEIGDSITIQGQVAYPGSYGLRDGERLSSVIRRAGGFRATAYAEGTVLVRDEVRELEEKSRQELIRQIETSSAAARLSPTLGSDTPAALQLIKTQQDEILGQLKSQPATGRLVVHISPDISSWANTPYDVEVRRGDVITIPKRPGYVLVTGQVYNSTALTFTPGKAARWYLGRAGGTSNTADRKDIFVIRANGSILGRRSGRWGSSDVLSTKLNPGDVVVVPQKVLGSSQLWKNLLTAAQFASSIAITAAVAAL